MHLSLVFAWWLRWCFKQRLFEEILITVWESWEVYSWLPFTHDCWETQDHWPMPSSLDSSNYVWGSIGLGSQSICVPPFYAEYSTNAAMLFLARKQEKSWQQKASLAESTLSAFNGNYLWAASEMWFRVCLGGLLCRSRTSQPYVKLTTRTGHKESFSTQLWVELQHTSL